MDHVAEMVSRLRVGLRAKLRRVIVPQTKKTLRIADVMYDLGYISGYTVVGTGLSIFLRYASTNRAVLRRISLLSRSSVRSYWGVKRIKRGGGYAYTNGFVIFATSKDVRYLTDIECLMLRIGGEPVVAFG